MYELYGPAGDTTAVRSRIKIVPEGATLDGIGISADGIAAITGCPLTFACWCEADTLSTANGCIVSVSQRRINDRPGRFDDYQLGYAGAGALLRMSYSLGANRQSATVSASSLGITNGTLFHFAGTCVRQTGTFPNRGVLRLFVNGLSAASLNGTANLPETDATVQANGGLNRTTIGCSMNNLNAGLPNGGENYWDGRVGEVGIWDVELTPEEIMSLAEGFRCDQVRPQNLKLYMPLAGERSIVVGTNDAASLEVAAANPTQRPHPTNTHPPRYG